MKKHTNITNEITGAYYPRKYTLADFFISFITYSFILVAILVFIMLVFIMLVLDFVFGAETVSEVIGEFIFNNK